MIRITQLLLLLALVNLSLQRDQFCPLERNENQCRARKNQYKCGAFLMSLAGQEEKIRWLGALPDMLHKPSVRKSRALMQSMGNLNRKNFRLIPGFCNEILANIRCFDLMKTFSKIPLDSCDYSMLNEEATETLGNVLCKKAQRFAPGQNFQSFVSIGFYHSACNGNWTETHRSGHHLRMEEELCCKFDKGEPEFFRCNGADYQRTCPDPNLKDNELEGDSDRSSKSRGRSPFPRRPASPPRRFGSTRALSSSRVALPDPPPRVTVSGGSTVHVDADDDADGESLISAVSLAGDDSPAASRIPRKLQNLKLGEIKKTVHKVGSSSTAKKERPKVRTYYVRNGRITRTELS